MGRAPRPGRRALARALSDIFAGQPADPALLAEIYDLEHDEIREDLVFYRELTRRAGTAVVDLGCGSGRLFRSFADGGATRITGIDAAPALLDRARARVAGDRQLAELAAHGGIALRIGDVREPVDGPHDLAVLAGVVAHLEGPDDARRAFAAAGAGLAPGGLLVLDTLGPGGLPGRDLELSVDWRRRMGEREVVRRSSLTRRETPDGLRVSYATLVDLVEPDGTIGRLPASYRLWYPSPGALRRLVRESGLAVEAAYGSHDLDRLGPESERCIIIARRGTGGSPGGSVKQQGG